MLTAVTFRAVVCFLDVTIRFNVRQSLLLNFSFHPLFYFSKLVMPHCVYAVINLDTVPLETPKSWGMLAERVGTRNETEHHNLGNSGTSQIR
ncbi:hypothetical protein TNCV_1880171 [Trichonephila clavipes]|nr:hypothetical protein TNCV_1880171 [Trichonephila clavipes]